MWLYLNKLVINNIEPNYVMFPRTRRYSCHYKLILDNATPRKVKFTKCWPLFCMKRGTLQNNIFIIYKLLFKRYNISYYICVMTLLSKEYKNMQDSLTNPCYSSHEKHNEKGRGIDYFNLLFNSL